MAQVLPLLLLLGIGAGCVSRTPGFPAQPQMRPPGRDWQCVYDRPLRVCHRTRERCLRYRRGMIARAGWFGKLAACKRREGPAECHTFLRSAARASRDAFNCRGRLCRLCFDGLRSCERSRLRALRARQRPSACTTWR